MAKSRDVVDELEWMRERYPNAKRFKSEQEPVKIVKPERKPVKDGFSTHTPKLDERCNLFWGILDTLNMGKVHPKKIRYMRKCRKFIKEHHEKMKDDPERLATGFLIKLTGCNCEKERSIRGNN